MQPKILIAFDGDKFDYEEAVRKCEAQADSVYLPDAELEKEYDGLILAGGVDIEPKNYGQENVACKKIDIERDKSELSVLAAFVKSGKPILGVCRGHQLINVYFKGTLIQDLKNKNEHISTDDFKATNMIKCKKGSVCHKLYGEEFLVNSYHHQAVDKIGKGMLCTGKCGEVIESCEHESLPIISVQWHPERMCTEEKPKGTVDGLKIINYFVDMCRK